MLIEKLEIRFKIGYGTMIRMHVVNSQSASHIDKLKLHPTIFKPLFPPHSPDAQILKSTKIGDLRTDMKMYSHQFEMRCSGNKIQRFRQILFIQSKFVLIQSGCESSDTFGKNREINKAKRGDLIAIRSAGAYGEVMASQYNCRELPKSYFSDQI